jgi:hypothetical protein
MSLEHSPAREKKRVAAAPALDQLLDFDDLAQRWGVARKTVKTSWRRWGLRPVRIAKRVLFPVSQVLEMEHRSIKSGERL